MLLSELLLITFVLLFLAMIVASLCRNIPVPYTVLLVILGLVSNFQNPCCRVSLQSVSFS